MHKAIYAYRCLVIWQLVMHKAITGVKDIDSNGNFLLLTRGEINCGFSKQNFLEVSLRVMGSSDLTEGSFKSSA
jgi:hypothetical protein